MWCWRLCQCCPNWGQDRLGRVPPSASFTFIRSAWSAPFASCKTPPRRASLFRSFALTYFLHLPLNIYHNTLAMLSSLLSLRLALWLTMLSGVLAAPNPPLTAGQSITMYKRSPRRSAAEWEKWAKTNRDMLRTKYGAPLQKRSSGTNLSVVFSVRSLLVMFINILLRITNQNADSRSAQFLLSIICKNWRLSSVTLGL